MHENAQLALDTILRKPTKGVPSWLLHIMEHAQIERLAGAPPGAYRKQPEKVYLAFQRAVGTCLLDQFIPDNPLTMGDAGFDDAERGPTTGGREIVLDGVRIRSPEDVVAHMERFVFPALAESARSFDEDCCLRRILAKEQEVQEKLGPTILKGGHNFIRFPDFAYYAYGYENYFMAYELYPEVIERHFALQADLAIRNNRAAARAYAEGGLPPFYRLDHDIADSRGTLVDVRSLDRLWLPHFARAIEPTLGTGVRMLWHCDGNLMALVPRLLDAGIAGFQGFQYEAGMDYERICRMKARDGGDLVIIGGVSVTRTLPRGTPEDVKRELAWLVEKGPRTGLFIAASSSITPGVPWENIQALVEGLRYYRERGRR